MIVVVAALLAAAVWTLATHRGSDHGIAALLLRGLVGVSPAAERSWIVAMLAEHDALDDPRVRRRFARGCIRAMLRPRRDLDATATLGGRLIGVAAVGAFGLAAWALIHYPYLRTGWLWIVMTAVVVVALTGYAVIGVWLSKMGSRSTRWAALVASTPAIVVGWWAGHNSGVVGSTTVLSIAIPICVLGAGVARSERHRDRAGVAVGYAGIAASLFTFVSYVATTYVTGGGRTTAPLQEESAQSGARNYRDWVIGDNLDGAVFLLLVVPLVAVTLGLLAARLASRTAPPPIAIGPNPR